MHLHKPSEDLIILRQVVEPEYNSITYTALPGNPVSILYEKKAEVTLV